MLFIPIASTIAERRKIVSSWIIWLEFSFVKNTTTKHIATQRNTLETGSNVFRCGIFYEAELKLWCKSLDKFDSLLATVHAIEKIQTMIYRGTIRLIVYERFCWNITLLLNKLYSVDKVNEETSDKNSYLHRQFLTMYVIHNFMFIMCELSPKHLLFCP